MRVEGLRVKVMVVAAAIVLVAVGGGCTRSGGADASALATTSTAAARAEPFDFEVFVFAPYNQRNGCAETGDFADLAPSPTRAHWGTASVFTADFKLLARVPLTPNHYGGECSYWAQMSEVPAGHASYLVRIGARQGVTYTREQIEETSSVALMEICRDGSVEASPDKHC